MTSLSIGMTGSHFHAFVLSAQHRWNPIPHFNSTTEKMFFLFSPDLSHGQYIPHARKSYSSREVKIAFIIARKEIM